MQPAEVDDAPDAGVGGRRCERLGLRAFGLGEVAPELIECTR
jgi:hypothetical protein